MIITFLSNSYKVVFNCASNSHSDSGLYWASVWCFLSTEIHNCRPKLQISFKRVWSSLSIWWVLSSSDTFFSTRVTNFIDESLVFIELLVGAFFSWYKIFHRSYKSHSRESGLCWASDGCFLLLIIFFPKLQISFKRVWYVLSIWWVLSSADTKLSTQVTNLIQESPVFIEHLVGAFFCWYKVFPTKVQSSLKLCLCVSLYLSLSLFGAFSVSFIELSGGVFYFPFLWGLMGIVSLTLFWFFK